MHKYWTFKLHRTASQYSESAFRTSKMTPLRYLGWTITVAGWNRQSGDACSDEDDGMMHRNLDRHAPQSPDLMNQTLSVDIWQIIADKGRSHVSDGNMLLLTGTKDDCLDFRASHLRKRRTVFPSLDNVNSNIWMKSPVRWCVQWRGWRNNASPIWQACTPGMEWWTNRFCGHLTNHCRQSTVTMCPMVTCCCWPVRRMIDLIWGRLTYENVWQCLQTLIT